MMDSDELSAMNIFIGQEVPFEDETEMLDLLFEHGNVQPKQEWGVNAYDSLGVFASENCPVPPIYPTFDCDPHNSADPRSVSSFLSSPDQSPPSSPSDSSSLGESSPEIGRADIFDAMPQVQFQGGEFSTNDLLCTTFASQMGTIIPSALHAEMQSTVVLQSPASVSTYTAAGKAESRKRKRSRKNAEEPTLQTAVTLPRKELLKLSSQELDEYANRLRASRPLTPLEEKDLRRQRRLIKNRESASLSRQRRKEHMDDLEVQVDKLNAENEELKARIEALSAENTVLRERLQRYECEEVQQSPSIVERLRKSVKINAPSFSAKSSAATAGACLAIVLFGFGLLFNAPLRADLASGGSFYAPTPTVIEHIVPPLPVEPEITSIAKASRGSSNKGYDFPEWRIRKPLEMDEPGSASMPIDVDADEDLPPFTVAKKFASSHYSKIQVEMDSDQTLQPGEPEPTNTSTEHYADLLKQQGLFVNTPEQKESVYTATPSTKPTSPHYTTSQQQACHEMNTTDVYLLCPQAQPIWATEQAAKRTIAPDTSLTLLLPADLLGSVDGSDTIGKFKALLQVTCRVSDVKSVCMRHNPQTPTVVPCSS